MTQMTHDIQICDPDYPSPLINAMSVDVEDYFHAEALISIRQQAGSPDYPYRFEASTDRVLALFSERGIKATFFTLGWVAEKAPNLIARIAAEGHELACHSFGHTRVVEQDRAGFLDDLRRAKGALEDAGGQALKGYRAPTFSLTGDTIWAYDILVDEGFSYSSSIYPVAHDLYGMPGSPRVPYRPVADLPIVEIPMSTVRFGSRVMQGGGGGYFRLLPLAVSRYLMKRVNAQERAPFIFYFHPWELDVDQPRVSSLPAKSRLRHYTNLNRMEAKLSALLEDCPWAPMAEVYGGLFEERAHSDLSQTGTE